MSMKRSKLFVYALAGKTVFPYNEYQISLNSTVYDGTPPLIQPRSMTTSSVS